MHFLKIGIAHFYGLERTEGADIAGRVVRKEQLIVPAGLHLRYEVAMLDPKAYVIQTEEEGNRYSARIVQSSGEVFLTTEPIFATDGAATNFMAAFVKECHDVLKMPIAQARHAI